MNTYNKWGCTDLSLKFVQYQTVWIWIHRETWLKSIFIKGVIVQTTHRTGDCEDTHCKIRIKLMAFLKYSKKINKMLTDRKAKISHCSLFWPVTWPRTIVFLSIYLHIFFLWTVNQDANATTKIACLWIQKEIIDKRCRYATTHRCQPVHLERKQKWVLSLTKWNG